MAHPTHDTVAPERKLAHLARTSITELSQLLREHSGGNRTRVRLGDID